jgi:hypothetical protein
MSRVGSTMKYFSCLWLALLLVSLSACKKDEPVSEQEVVTALLTSATAWQSPEVTIDGVNYTDLYKDFKITFDKTTYTTVAGAPAWKPSGTWTFLNEEGTLIKMDNDREVEIKSISDELLEISFVWSEDTFEPGRTTSIKGKQTFKLRRG